MLHVLFQGMKSRQSRYITVPNACLDGQFGQCWKDEIVNSVIKRKFGDTIRSRTLRLQRREPIIKAMVLTSTTNSFYLCKRVICSHQPSSQR
jgi:hypothetical protein